MGDLERDPNLENYPLADTIFQATFFFGKGTMFSLGSNSDCLRCRV